jgi:KDO2-lipid IV(A) lauroyltransferase
MKPIADLLVYIAARLLMAFIQIVPMSWCERLARGLAYLAVDVLGFREALIDENLRSAFAGMEAGERRRVARRMWEHLGLLVCETVLAPRKIHDTNWRRYISKIDNNLMSEYILDRRPTVFVSGHFGNFEIGGMTMGLFGFSSYAVARELDNPHLERMLRRLRESRGQIMLPKDGSATQIQAVLEASRPLMLLGDQHAGTKGVWIDFLGRPASCHKALALFTLSSGAPMLVTFCRRTTGILRFEVGVSGVADPREMPAALSDVRALTQWYNDCLAKMIREDPGQYWWVHRRWKDKPIRQTKARIQRAAA